MPTTITDIRDLTPTGYDRRRSTGTMPSHVAHGLAQNNRKTQVKRGMEECMAIANGFIQAQICENEGRYYVTSPKLPLHCGVCKAKKTDKTSLYNELLDLQALVLRTMDDQELIALANQYKEDF